ncbi:hypothetical protein RI129_008320 [Pyrocoelia pectoralis]|uniref:Uncharacterized protein n=1 Tax=Pyrocoelia pectoralis TaxID=417401 RepID=A0AAN7VB02_9COLE
MDFLQLLKEKSVYIDKGIHEINDQLSNLMKEVNKCSESIQQFDEETKQLEISVKNTISLLTEGIEEQERLLGECKNVINDEVGLTGQFQNEDYNSDNSTPPSPYMEDIENVPPIEEPNVVEDLNEINSSIEDQDVSAALNLLDKSLPRLF